MFAENYAVLIIGDEADYSGDRKLNPKIREDAIFSPFGGEAYWYIPMPEFWYDTVIMYNILRNNGFTDGNIFVLFGRGMDYEPTGWVIADEYNPEPNITDYPARKIDVQNIFTWMADGSNPDVPQFTPYDFLFVWTFDHGTWIGGTDTVGLNLMDPDFVNGQYDVIWDYEFAPLVNPLPYSNRVFWMQQCQSGGFIGELENDHTAITTACDYDEWAYPADNLDVHGNPITEWETINGHVYRHGEFNHHMMAAARGRTPAGFLTLEADLNLDGFVSNTEAKEWEFVNDSRWHWEGISHPQHSDPGNIGSDVLFNIPPAAPQNLTVSYSANDHPLLEWVPNEEPDMDGCQGSFKSVPISVVKNVPV